MNTETQQTISSEDVIFFYENVKIIGMNYVPFYVDDQSNIGHLKKVFYCLGTLPQDTKPNGIYQITVEGAVVQHPEYKVEIVKIFSL